MISRISAFAVKSQMSSVLPILPFTLSGRNNDPRNYSTVPLEEPCLDCPMSSPECSEPLCTPFSALTTQCTDQCVVITCDDPDHADSSVCDKQGSNSRCDDIIDCTDCDGFEDFLQCCENYASLHPLPSQSQRALDPHQAFSWEAPFNDVWCNDCTTTKSTGLERQLESNLAQHAATQSGSHPGLQQRNYPSLHRESHFHMDSFPPFISDGRPSFSCMWGSCGASFASLTELIGHVNLNHLVSSNSSTFPNALLPAHDLQLEQIKPPMTCRWGDCTNQAISSFHDTDLLYHLLREHLGVTPPPSGPLDQASPVTQSTPHSLSFDTTICQGIPPQYNVNDHTQGQETHLRATSPGSASPVREDDPHSCSGIHECKWKECGLFFPTCAELTTHITAIHIGSGQAQYECFWDQCPRSGVNGFQSKQKICRHVQSHTGHRPFQCTICQQYFSEAATLQQHIRRHTQEKPYVCDHPGCGKSFAITGALTIHKRTHNGDKPFKCLYCERGFAESSNLSKHLRTHTGARPYACAEPNCGKAFARPDQLNRHKSVHKKQHRGVGSDG